MQALRFVIWVSWCKNTSEIPLLRIMASLPFFPPFTTVRGTGDEKHERLKAALPVPLLPRRVAVEWTEDYVRTDINHALRRLLRRVEGGVEGFPSTLLDLSLVLVSVENKTSSISTTRIMPCTDYVTLGV